MEGKIESNDVCVCKKNIKINDVMKTILYFMLVLCICFSCSDVKIKDTQSVLEAIEKPVNQEQNLIINELKPVLLHVAKSMATLSRSSENVAYQTENEFDEIKFSSLPYYELNENEFYEDPSPENLMSCIHPVKDRYFFLGKKNGNIAIVLEAINRDSKWYKGFSIEGMKYFEENFSWMVDRFINCDANSIYFLKFLSDIYVACSIEGEPYFFNFIGSFGFDKKAFASAMLNAKNRKDRYEKYFQEKSQNVEKMKILEKNRNMTHEKILMERKESNEQENR